VPAPNGDHLAACRARGSP